MKGRPSLEGFEGAGSVLILDLGVGRRVVFI